MLNASLYTLFMKSFSVLEFDLLLLNAFCNFVFSSLTNLLPISVSILDVDILFSFPDDTIIFPKFDLLFLLELYMSF
jgi:hypothetical protein